MTFRCACIVALVLSVIDPAAAQGTPEAQAIPTSELSPASNWDRRIAEDFVPMTRSERLAYAIRSVSHPSMFLLPAISSAINQTRNEPPEWGRGIEGYSRRYGSDAARRFIAQTIQHGTAYALGEDDRYFALGQLGFGRRFQYAVASTVLARHDDGSRHLSVSDIGSAAGSAFISRIWQPPSDRSAGSAAKSFGITMGLRAGLNVAREFAPRFMVKFLP